MPMVSALQVMCGFGVMRSIAATFGPVYRAIAKPDIPLKINIIHLSFLCIVIYPMGVKWGLLGVAIAISVSMIVALVLTSIKIMSVLKVKFMQLFKPVIISIIASAACGLLVIGAKGLFENFNCYSLSILMGIGAVGYIFLIRIVHRVLGFEKTNFYEVIRSAG
jgi:O-antigen/teichoic acid export membrane protein